MQTRRRKAPSHNLSVPQLAGAYRARKRRTLKERSFEPSDRAGIEASLGRPIDELEEGTLRGAQERGDRVAIERGRVWPIEIEEDIWGASISDERAAQREAIHRYGALVIDGSGRWHGMSPRAASEVFAGNRDPRPANVVRPPAAGARARQSHGASHGSSARRGGDSGDDSGPSGSSGDGDGDAERAPTLVEAFRVLIGRDPKPGRLCACGCGTSLDGRRPQTVWFDSSHQQRWNEERERPAAAAEESRPATAIPHPSLIPWDELADPAVGSLFLEESVGREWHGRRRVAA